MQSCVESWFLENPNGSISQCARALNISRPTARKWMPEEQKLIAEQKQLQKKIGMKMMNIEKVRRVLHDSELNEDTKLDLAIVYASDDFQDMLKLFPDDETFSIYAAIFMSAAFFAKEDENALYDKAYQRIVEVYGESCV